MPRGKAQVNARTVQLLDLYPTLAELCGLPPPPPPANEGHSFATLLSQANSAWNHSAFSVTLFQGKLGRSVRTERWHYVEWDEGRSGAMLCDTVKDPYELKNLAEDPAYAKTVAEMKGLLKQLPAN